MPQETRKDPRAKVLTMTVRYKSANLDEFIEHHSHDVSRGGMFIKTPSPFPAGTLLKFEVRIGGDQRVMQGVGRVVWKRDPTESPDPQPPGMGVKFIKIDEASRAVIDQLVNKAGGVPTAFDRGSDGGVAAAPAAASSAAAPSAAAHSASAAPKASAAEPAKPPRKGTMIGLGAVSTEPAKLSPGVPDEASSGFFPETKGEDDMPPPEDRTVMKQAAELLQDALREAGGSMDEIGSTADKPDAKDAAASKKKEAASVKPAPAASTRPTVKEPVKTKPAEAKPATAKAAPASTRPRSEPTRRVSIPAEDGTEGGASGGSKTVVVLLAVAAVAVVAFLLLRGPKQEPPVPLPEAAKPEPAAVEAPMPAPDPTPAETAAAPGEPEPSAAAPAATSAAPVATPAPAEVKPAPVEATKPVAPKPAAPKPAAPKPAETAAPAGETPKPVEVKPAEPKPAAPKPAAPKPAPKAPAEEGDNPY